MKNGAKRNRALSHLALACGVWLPVVACSGGNGATSAGADLAPECPQPVGAYQVTFVKLGGTCADLPPRVVILDEPDRGCTRSYVRATKLASGCKLDEKASCTTADGSITATETITLDIPSDLRQISGTYTVDAESNTVQGKTCTGTYAATYVKS